MEENKGFQFNNNIGGTGQNNGSGQSYNTQNTGSSYSGSGYSPSGQRPQGTSQGATPQRPYTSSQGGYGSGQQSAGNFGGYGRPSGATPTGGQGGSTPQSGGNDKDENLRKLQQQLNNSQADKEKKKRKRRIIIWIIIILLLLAMVGVGIYFFIGGSGSLDLGSSIRLSIDLDEQLESDKPEDSIFNKPIYPGDEFPVVISVRNANNYGGDIETLDVVPIYVRYKIELIIEGKSYSNVIIPDIQQSNWTWGEGDNFDGFYYYNGILASQQSIRLFTSIKFDFANTLNWMAGKSASIVIIAEAVEANPTNIGEAEAWGTAPQAWLDQIKG